MGILGRWYGKSVLARSFSFQCLPAEKVQDEESSNQGSQGEAGQGDQQAGRGEGKGRSRRVNWH